MSARFDAFLAYAKPYREWVRAFHHHLETAGARVFFEDVDFGPGQSWVQQLQSGLSNAARMLLVVTPEALASPRVQDEWGAFITAHPDWARLQLIVPILLIDAPLPPFLEQVVRIDLREHDDRRYRQGLHDVLKVLALGRLELRGAPPPRLPAAPPWPAPAISAAQRQALVDGIAPLVRTKASRVAVVHALGLKEGMLEGYPSPACAASAALVFAVGSQDPAIALRRAIESLVLQYEDEPDHAQRLRALSSQLEALYRPAEDPLLTRYQQKVIADHASLVDYFRSEALERVYVDLALQPDKTRTVGDDGETAMSVMALLEAAPAAGRVGRWVLKGDPGAGKTTLLRYLAVKLARLEDPHRVPVYGSLPRLMQQREFLLARIEREMLRSDPEAGGVQVLLDQAGRNGDLVMLLDGLDEVPAEDRVDAVALIRELSNRWPETPLLVTTRPIGYRTLSGFQDIGILPLDRDRRIDLLARWFVEPGTPPDRVRAEEAIRMLEADPGLWEISGNPLYLTLIALLLNDGQQPDRHRSRLYDQVFELLLQGKHRRGEALPLPMEFAVRAALRFIADRLTRENRDALPVAELEMLLYHDDAREIRQELEKYPGWRASMRLFLGDLAERTGIIGPHDGEHAEWRFWHRTFREALASEALYERLVGEPGRAGAAGSASRTGRVGPESYASIIEHARTLAGEEGQWAEPYALLAGRLPEPDELVRALVRTNRVLGLRALATAQGLRGETLRELLELSDDWQQRREVFERLVDLVGDPERGVRLLDQVRATTRNGNDLFFIDRALESAGRRWPDVQPLAEAFRQRLFAHIPAPEPALFRAARTRDGQVPLWQEIPPGAVEIGDSVRQRVGVTAPFWMGVVPVTNAQYAAFDPGHGRGTSAATGEEAARLPVVDVTWYEAITFCRWLATLPGTRGARLPRELEWEYACRQNTLPGWAWWCGSSDDLPLIAWYRSNAQVRRHAAGEKPRSPAGLYDMHGNVREWCADPWLQEAPSRTKPVQIDPVWSEIDPAFNVSRVTRGGCYRDDADNIRASTRTAGSPGTSSALIGFRVLLPVAPLEGGNPPLDDRSNPFSEAL